ncbi:MAG TPA: hypothetical protein VK009_20180 [Chloroflexota bacterium]|nr:hypothetical protein [Chloroflexota bacterium]
MEQLTAPSGRRNGSSAPSPADQSGLDELASELAARRLDIFDEWTVTALLESSGLGDGDARQRYGLPDLFCIGRLLFPRLPVPVEERPAAAPAMRSEWSFRKLLASYSIGLVYFVPTFGLIVGFMLLGYSLWAWAGFTLAQATAIGLATLGSLVVTAPAVQAIAARGYYYLNTENYRLLRVATARLTLVGIGLALVSCALLAGLWQLAGLASADYFVAYFLLLAVFWLCIARIDVVNLRWLVSASCLVGLVCVFGLRQFDWISMSHAQWAGLGAVDAGLIALTEWRLRSWVRDTPANLAAVPLLPMRALLAQAWPIFTYGAAYYVFLFIDRLVSWSAQPKLPGQLLVFRGDYEAGLDLALLVLFLCTMLLEYTIRVFSEQLIPATDGAGASDRAGVRRTFLSLYARQGGLMLLVAAASVLFTLFAVPLLPRLVGGSQQQVFELPLVAAVFRIAVASYVVFALGLFSAVFLQNLARRGTVVAALAGAMMLDVGVGELAVQRLGYAGACIGLLAGCIFFALATTLAAIQTLRRVPYQLAAVLA